MDRVKTKEKEKLTIAEAIENLSSIAEMEIDEKTPIGLLQDKKLTTREEDFTYKEIEWLFPEVPQNFIDNIKPTYRVVLEYLKEMYHNPETDWENEKTIHGIQSVMNLVGDAANKIKEYFALFHQNVDFTQTEEFQAVENFFREFILKKIPQIEGKEAWEKDWDKNKKALLFDVEKRGLKDFESITKDEDYELLYIRDENDASFLTGELVQNLKLYARLESEKEEKEDPFIMLKKLHRRDIQISSRQILNMLEKEIHEFYKFQFNCVKNRLAGAVNKSIMALMLAANPGNLNKMKSCRNYFEDFQTFLREGFHSEEYRKVITKTEEKKDANIIFLVRLLNKISYSLFNRFGGVKEEFIGFVHYLKRKGQSKEKLEKASLWSFLEETDDNIHSFLNKFSNATLSKILEVLRLEEEKVVAFDPIIQGNIPERLYDISKKGVLRLPCPTKQEIISKADIVEEFLGFLRVLKEEKKSHLLINLQDRLSWRENARSKALEDLEQNSESSSAISVVSLSKDSSFYHQNDNYFAFTNGFRFIDEFKKLLLNNEEGFFIPARLKTKELTAFVDDCLNTIYNFFFLEKADLSRQERLDFIEIFYHFFILKLIEMTNPMSISFTSKDAIDSSSILNASFYSFVKLLNKSHIGKEDEDYLLWLIYTPAFLIRNRAVNSTALIRLLSALAFFDAHKDGCRQKFSHLFEKSFFNSLEIHPEK